MLPRSYPNSNDRIKRSQGQNFYFGSENQRNSSHKVDQLVERSFDKPLPDRVTHGDMGQLTRCRLKGPKKVNREDRGPHRTNRSLQAARTAQERGCIQRKQRSLTLLGSKDEILCE